jgi:hypothetical protein
MSRMFALVALFVSVAPTTTAEPPADGSTRLGAIRRGMSPEEVRRVLGSPQRIFRQLLYRRYIEQWQYDDLPGWVEFNVPRGEEPYILNVHADKISQIP